MHSTNGNVFNLQHIGLKRQRENTDLTYVRLSGRELEVLHLVALGQLNKEVAQNLFVSKRTVDFHLGKVYTKLGVSNRMRAVRLARRLGMLPFEPDSINRKS